MATILYEICTLGIIVHAWLEVLNWENLWQNRRRRSNNLYRSHLQTTNLYRGEAEVQIGCLQVASVQIIGSTSEVLSQIHNLLDITCIRFYNRIAGDVVTCNTIDIPCNTIGKSYTHGLLTTIGQMVISNRLCIWDKTSDVDPIIFTLVTRKQPICTSASRWLLYRLLDRRFRFCNRFSQTTLSCS